MYLLKLTMLLVNPWSGHFCPQSSIRSNFKYGPLDDIRDLDLVVSTRRFCMFQFISQCKLCVIHQNLGRLNRKLSELLSYFQPNLAAMFVTIAMGKFDLI